MPESVDFPTVLDSVQDIEGWMTPGQASALFDAAHRCPPHGRIVEIGSFRGRSTIVLASAAPPEAEVVAIEPHAGNDRGPQELTGYSAEADLDRERFAANLAVAGLEERVRHVRAFSGEAHDQVDDPVDVLYVDGAHRYGPASDDIRSWGGRVAPSGTLLIHDSFSSLGVTLAILRHLLLGSRFRYLGRSRSLAIYRADLEPGLSPRVRNVARQLAQLPWFLRNLVLKVLLTARLGRLLERFDRTPPEWPY